MKDIETQRLVLKAISKDDRDFIFSEFSDKAVTKYLYDEEPVTDMQGADQIISMYTNAKNKGQCRWVLTEKITGEKIGTCGFHLYNPESGAIDVGYDMKEVFWGHGYMREALTAAIASIKNELEVRRIDAHIYAGNEKSAKLVKRLGFTYNGREYMCKFRDREYLHHVYVLNCEPEQIGE